MSSLFFSADDKDLDDADLWAVIDSAAASHSSSTKPPPSRYLTAPVRQNPHPISPNLYRTPAKSTRNPRSEPEIEEDGIGEVVQVPPASRPCKIARIGDRICGENQMVVMPRRHIPVSSPVYSSPSSGSYGSPEVSYPSPVGSLETGRMTDVQNFRHSLSGRFPSVSLFKQYQNAAMAILEKGDYTMVSGHPFIKKTGWRKISFFFNLSFEIKDKTIEFDQYHNVQRAEFIVRAFMQGGRFSDGWGSCERNEKRFMKPNHDIPSTAETRAKNKACQDLLGIGEYRPGAGHAS